MNVDLYQKGTLDTFIKSSKVSDTIMHVVAGVGAESGEVLACFQKFARGDFDYVELTRRLEGEIGGLMYYTAMLCNIMNLNLSDIMRSNRESLLSRKERGVIKGDGDGR